MPEWKGYEPGSPEAIEAAGKYEPPKAVIQEAPPAKPKPPPTPPTLEPVIPQPYVPPVNAVPVAWHSLKGAVDKEGRPDPWAEDKTKPTVLKTPDGVLYFTPHHKTMWGELGMRNIKDYADYLRTGQPSQYVGITEGVDKPVMVSRRELAKTSELVGEEQFKAMIDVGVIPRGSKFMPGPGGYQGKDWSYIHPDTLKKMKGEILARLARRSTKKPRVVIPPGMRVEPPGVPEPTGVPGGPPTPQAPPPRVPISRVEEVVPEELPIVKPPIEVIPPSYKPLLATYEANIEKAEERQKVIIGKIKNIAKGLAEITLPMPTGPAKMPEDKLIKLPPEYEEKRQEFIDWQREVATPIGDVVKRAVVFITPVTKRTHKEMVGYKGDVEAFNDKWRKELAEESVKADRMPEFDVDFAVLESKGKVIEDSGIEIDLLVEQIDKHNAQIEAHNRKWGRYSVIPDKLWAEYQSDYNKLNVADVQFANAFGTYQSLSSEIDAYNTEVNAFDKKWGYMEKLGMSASEASLYESEADKLLGTSYSLEERIERDKNILFNNGFPGESLALVWGDKLTSLSEMTIPFVYTIRRRELMDGAELAFSVATDIAAVMLFYYGGKALGTAGRALSKPLRKLKSVAKKAGKADMELHAVLKEVKRPVISRILRPDRALLKPRTAKKLQQAQLKSKRADEKFLNTLDRMSEVSWKSLKKLEKASGYDGLASITKRVGDLQGKLRMRWNQLDKMAFHPDIKSPKAIAKMPKPQQIRHQNLVRANNRYLRQLDLIRRTQLALDRAMIRAGELFRPRVREAPHAGWEQVINAARQEWIVARRTLNQAEKIYKQEPSKINKLWVDEARADLKLADSRLEELMLSMRNGEFPPEFRGYGMEWKTKAKPPELKPGTDRTIKEIENFLSAQELWREPLFKPTSGLKTRVAVKTAPKVVEPKVKTVQHGRLKEIYKESKAKIKPKEVAPPKIKKKKALPKDVEQVAKKYIPATITRTAVRRVGRVDPDAFVEAVAVELTKYLDLVKGFVHASPTERISQQAQIRAAIQAAILAFNKAQIAQLTRAGIRDAIKEAVEQRLKLAPKEEVKPLVKPIVTVKVTPKVKPIEKPPIKPPIPKPKILLPLPRKKTDKKKRERIKKSKGAIAWRHGELHGKDVFHVGLYPYTKQSDYLTVVGKKPQGATVVKGPGSARQSIKLLYGKSPPRTVKGDIGFFDFAIKPTGPKMVDIDFTPDPKMQTTGDITIGGKTPPITERPVGLGRSKSPRITPRTPRLRR